MGYWSKSDREIYLKYFHTLKILYIHGLSSSGSSGTAELLRRYLPDDIIFSPDLPINPQEALTMLKELAEREGGMFAQKVRGSRFPMLMVEIDSLAHCEIWLGGKIFH